jgi:prephenate dehydrogenase
MAARKEEAASSIRIWARRAETRLELREQPWCDSIHTDPAEAVADADLVVICSPVDKIVPLASTIAPHLKPGALVTDVGSVKGDLCRSAVGTLGGPDRFIGSHPMAGSEKTGWRVASADLFRNRTCFVTPLPGTPEPLIDRLTAFWDKLGARVTTCSPDEHDEIVAAVSHLPHLASAALAALLHPKPPAWRGFCGNGLRDTTRIAAGDPDLWVAILESNREEVLRALRSYQDLLEEFHAALANKDPHTLKSLLRRAKTFRDDLA